MEVDASCSSSRHYPQEIDQLLEAFGSAFSVEYIASTFLQANRDVDIAGEILCELQATAASTAPRQHKDETDMSSRVSAGTCNSSGSELHPRFSEGHIKSLDSRGGPSVMGCVAGVTGKDYTRPGTSKSVQDSSGRVTTETAHKDVDEFLFKMLGDGFQLDINVIHEVLSTCGYDMEKSMETLLDKSASTLGKSDDVLSKAPDDLSKSYEGMMDPSCQGKSQHENSVRSSKKRNKDKCAIEKELLQSLFTSKRPEDGPKKSHPRKEISSSGRFGRVVTKPLEDTPIEHQTLYVTPLQPSKDEEEDEDSFHVLRQAVKEHWATMKEYYKAAGEAFLKGDHAQANRLMEQGNFFSRKAREVDEKSLQKIVGTRDEEEVLFDFSTLEPRESVQHLRSQLVILCGIPNIPYIKVKLGNGEGGAKEVSRKRLILKLLEKESIKWTEMENGKLILIRVDEIERGSLSFSKST